MNEAGVREVGGGQVVFADHEVAPPVQLPNDAALVVRIELEQRPPARGTFFLLPLFREALPRPVFGEHRAFAQRPEVRTLVPLGVPHDLCEMTPLSEFVGDAPEPRL